MIGEGVHKEYKETAKNGGDILWHVTIKGQKELTQGIHLHMSLKVFEDKKDMDIEELKRKVKEFDIKTPDPRKLRFRTTIFTSQRDGLKYYMLLIDGSDKAYEDFYDSLKHCGTVYKKFMPHITIDKVLYEKINKEGLKPEEIEFQELTIEAGAGNTIYEFEKSEQFVPIMKETAFYTDLRNSVAISLPTENFKNWLQDNPQHKSELLAKHEERVRFHFGTEEVAKYALEHGIAKTYEFLRKNKCN
jgi:hypothetical protein